MSYLNILNLESKNDGPYEAKGQRLISIGDILRSDILQINLSLEIF